MSRKRLEARIADLIQAGTAEFETGTNGKRTVKTGTFKILVDALQTSK